jgi:probable F420-dependent oxidoreductase
MKIGLMYVNAGPFGDPDNLAHLARTAEAVGIESLWTVEHAAIPVGYQSVYPYDPRGRMPGPESVPIADPLVALAYCAGVTERIRLATGVLILAQRHPIYVAKELATLDVLSKGRALLGVGIGWLREEFEALGLPFAQRAARAEESIRALRVLWAREPQAFKGKHFQWDAVESNPKPIQPGGVPIVVGGHVEGAARRAARLGNGFFPALSDAAKLRELIAALRDECARIGRDPAEIELTCSAPPALLAGNLDALRGLQDLGVARVTLGPPAFDRDGITRGLEALGERVIARL